MWGRLSPHPALETEGGRRVRPTRVAPLALFLRDDAKRLLSPASNQLPLLSHPARDVFVALESHGASFFNELVRATGRLASEVEDGLWELVAAGLVTGDGFENVRALDRSQAPPRRRPGAQCAALVTPLDAGRCSIETQSRPRSSSSPDSFWIAGAWCSATCCRAKLSRRPGGICFRCTAEWKRAAKSAAAGSSAASWASSLRGPKRSICCGILRRSAKTGEQLEIAPADPLELEWHRPAGSANGRADAGPAAPAGRSSASRRILTARCTLEDRCAGCLY